MTNESRLTMLDYEFSIESFREFLNLMREKYPRMKIYGLEESK